MKIKKIPEKYFLTILDRLTRFEPAYIRYQRVYNDIINKFSFDNKVSAYCLNDKIKLVEDIFQYTFESDYSDHSLTEFLVNLEDKYFISNELSYQYLSSRVNISDLINSTVITSSTPQNVICIKEIYHNLPDCYRLRSEKSLLYPVEKIILCEGQTEEFLLEPIFGLFGLDFKKLGFKVIQAGGKNQVARKYYSMSEYVKLPFFILLDKDALKIKELIQSKLRKLDSLYLINSGEFEDLLPSNLLLEAINYIHKNELNCSLSDFDEKYSKVHCLDLIYKKYGFGEYKKAEFSRNLAEFILNFANKKHFDNSEIVAIISELSSTLSLQH